jgi:hypothetical protein
MSASNKLIVSLAQNLDADKKNQARSNIGAVGAFTQQVQLGTHTVTNDEADSGVFDIQLSHHSAGLYILCITVQSGKDDGLNTDRYPMRISADLNHADGRSTVELETSALERIDNSGNWLANIASLLPNTVNASSIYLHLYFGRNKIPANSTINFIIKYYLLSETKPS